MSAAAESLEERGLVAATNGWYASTPEGAELVDRLVTLRRRAPRRAPHRLHARAAGAVRPRAEPSGARPALGEAAGRGAHRLTWGPGSPMSTSRARWPAGKRRGTLGGGLWTSPACTACLPCADDPSTRLLVTDDRAYDALAEQLGRAREGTISVFATAARCAELLDGHPAWSRSDTSTAMVCRELETLPAVPLPGELTVRPVRRLDEDAPDGVPLEDAVTAALGRIRGSKPRRSRSPPFCARWRPRSASSPPSSGPARSVPQPAPAPSARRRTCSSSTPIPAGAAAA